MSLYRKYRPQTFEDVVGQDHVAHTLRNALASEPIRIAHAYLFCGPRGTGKTTTARLLAKCLNCESGPTSTPCNACDFCTRVRDNQAVMDLIEIDAASNTGVDNVRENIIDKVNVAPAQGRYRVYIIDEVHMLSTSSFNALLKTLEEPPPHAIFVLATTDAHKLPTTITSRCQRFDFRRVGPRDIVGRLQLVAENEKIELTENAARLIAHSADGALRDALTLLEQVSAFSPETINEADVRLVLGTVSQELIDELIRAVASRDALGVLRNIEHALDEGASFSQLTRDLVSYCRDLLLLTVGYEGTSTLTDLDKKHRHDFAQQMGRPRIMTIVEDLRATEKEMRQSTDHRLLLELALVRAASEDQSTLTPQAVVAQAVAVQPAAPVVNTPRPEPAPEHPSPAATEASAPPQPAWKRPAAEATSSTSAPENAPPSAALEEGEAPAAEAPKTVATASPAAGDTKKKGRRIHNMDEFVELWPKVLMRVRKKIGVTAMAYLHDAHPVALTTADAVLEFQKEFHYEKACEEAKRHPFEQVVNECLDAPRQLKFRLAPPKPAAPPEAEPAPVESDDDDEDDVFATAKQLFAAEVMNP